MQDPSTAVRARPRGARSRLAALLGASALAACAAIPNTRPRPQPTPIADLAATQSLAAPSADWPSDRWWDAYGDAQLSALIDDALKGSPTLAQAEARLWQADAQVTQSGAALLPSIDASAQVSETEQSRVMGFPSFIQQLLPKGYQDNGRVALNASYDLDLFGKNRAALAAAVSQRDAARADSAQARLTLSTAVAQAYGDLARLGAERDAAAEALRNRQESAQLVAARLRNGLENQGALKQANAATPVSQADLDSLDEQIILTRHKIAALLGEGPDRGLSIAMPKPERVKAFGLPGDARLNLIGRRPDIVAARLRVEAAARQIDVARAAFFPDITLSGYIGQQAIGLDKLFTPAAAIGSIGPAISLPIFKGGQLRGAYRGARAQYDEAVADYDTTLVQALQDLADSAVSAQSAAKQLADRRAALDAGEQAYEVARLRYQGGLSSYVEVLTAETAVIDERRAYADAQARAFTLDIALIRALGGGYAGA
ncbi:MAG TPA: efflux transporter outer membrane subunit [Caulobacteraceae bacterium]|nr:efflux transporter outer membrane subunit [Caulobacteraceae bacterium]